MSAKSLQKQFSIHEDSERRAYSSFINYTLKDDPDCERYLPIDPYKEDLYIKVQSGLLLCKLVNKMMCDSIDERTINVEEDLDSNYTKKMDNLCLMVNAARCRGANMGNVDINEIYNGDKCAILDLMWHIIRTGLMNKVNIYHHPEMLTLKKPTETIGDLKELNTSDIVLRYVNLHLRNSGLNYFIHDFDDDFKDCMVYAYLTYRVAPPFMRTKMIDPTTIENEVCVETRARDVITNLEILSCNYFLTEDDLINGFKRRSSASKLHICTMFTLFHYYNGDMPLNNPQHRTKLYGTGGECLDEFVYRNFINSFDVYPFSNDVIMDCRNGWIFSEMLEVLSPGICSGTRFILDFDHDRFYLQRVHNIMKILKLLPKLQISCDSLSAEKIANGDRSNITLLLYRIMRHYLYKQDITNDDIISWLNCQLKHTNKRKVMIQSLSDRTLKDPTILAALLESKTPGLINHSFLGANKLKNFRYLISIAHKAGIPIYTLAEHFVHEKSNFIGIAIATLLSH